MRAAGSTEGGDLVTTARGDGGVGEAAAPLGLERIIELLASSPVATVVASIDDATIRFVNRPLTELVGVEADHLVGRALTDLHDGPLPLLAELQAGGAEGAHTTAFRSPDGNQLRLRIRAHRLGDGRTAVAYLEDRTELEVAAELALDTTRLLTESTRRPVQERLDDVARFVERYAPDGAIAAVLRVDPLRQHLHLVAAPSADRNLRRPFETPMPLDRSRGPMMAAAVTGEAQWVDDLTGSFLHTRAFRAGIVADSPEYGAVLAVPLPGADRPAGVVGVILRRGTGPRPWLTVAAHVGAVAAAGTLASSESLPDRIAGLLHDGPVATLQATIDRLKEGAPLAETNHDVRRALDQCRGLLDDLVPLELRAEGDLAAAIPVAVSRVADQSTICAEAEVSELRGLRTETALARLVWRTVVEGIRNAARHGQAATVRVEASRTSTALRVIVEDDGHGPPPEASAAGGFGLGALQQDALAFGGELVLRPGHGGGARLQLQIPLGWDH